MTTEHTTITDEQLDDLERVSIIRRAQTPPENGPAITIECDTFDALITALRQARAQIATLQEWNESSNRLVGNLLSEQEQETTNDH